MILLNLYKNKNKKMPEAYGKYYARPAITQTIGIDGLSEHMSSHNTPFSPGAVKGMLTDMVICIRELCLQGIAVKIDNLAIFSIGIKHLLRELRIWFECSGLLLFLENPMKGKCIHAETIKAGDYTDGAVNLCYYEMS